MTPRLPRSKGVIAGEGKTVLERGEDLSSFVRRAVKREFAKLSYLSEEEKKALEIH